METSPLAAPSFDAAYRMPDKAAPASLKAEEKAGDKAVEDSADVREAFNDFVGQTFFGQMLSAMRKTVNKPAYFHGGRTEEVFQSQLDQVLAEKLSDASAETFTDPMYELFTAPRQL